jgi:hypothetical protein
MRDAEYHVAPGDPSSLGALRVPKARDLARLLTDRTLPFLSLVEVRRAVDGDVLVFDVQAEVPQRPEAEIRVPERLAVTFFDSDDRMPATAALRRDFPRDLPHLNLMPAGSPASLCLFAERYNTVRLRWTAAMYARRVHQWLSDTARGALHQEDQALEPFILPTAGILVLPRRVYTINAEEDLVVRSRGTGADRVVIASPPGDGIAPEDSEPHVALTIVTEPHVHGAIQAVPQTLRELHDFLTRFGTDLLGALQAKLSKWREPPTRLMAHVVLVTVVPKTRTTGGTTEDWEAWAFRPTLSVLQLGEALGLWDVKDGVAADRSETPQEQNDVPVEIFLPLWHLTPERAAAFSGVPHESPRVVAIGAGMLGSQVVMHLARSGFGQWTVIDNDRLLPHNLVRHALSPALVGKSKALVLAVEASMLFPGTSIATWIDGNVFDSRSSAEIEAALANADLVLDMSASPAVARRLTADVPRLGRLVSLFLTTTGDDLVLLAEDRGRAIRLDDLEMQHYRAALRNTDLKDHLHRAGQPLRYGQSCRDLTLSIAQDRAAVASGIAARAVRDMWKGDEAVITVWRSQPDGGVRVVSVPPERVYVVDVNGWHVRADEAFIGRLHLLRKKRLPTETGGVLIGHHDMQRRIIYLVHAISAPRDSKESIAFFERGQSGLQQEVRQIEQDTGGGLSYVGEWHSHPFRHPTDASDRDKLLFQWLAARMALDGLPPVMAIVGDNEVAIHVDKVTTGSASIRSIGRAGRAS